MRTCAAYMNGITGWPLRIGRMGAADLSEWINCHEPVKLVAMRCIYRIRLSLGVERARLDNLALWIGRDLSGAEIEKLWAKDEGWFAFHPTANHAVLYLFHDRPA